MPTSVRLATGAITAALLMLFGHNALKMPWPGVLPAAWWDWLYNAIEVAATVLCGTRILVRGHDRRAWAAITLGLAFFSAGDLYYAVVWGDANVVPVPSVADALYLAFYPCVYVGIGLLLRARVHRLALSLWLDGLIGALAVGALGAAFIFHAVLGSTHGPPLTVATNLAYPLADILLLGILVGIIGLLGWGIRGNWVVLAAGFVVFAVIDSLYLVESATGSYVSNGLLDVGWPAAMTIMALAAWRPPGKTGGERSEGWGTFLIPALAAAACIGLGLYDHFARVPLSAEILVSVCLLLVTVRLGLSFAENLAMLAESRRESLTDALTGLGNRRAVKLELERRLRDDPITPFVLAYYDLDGFKGYNDMFGHQAGDALLERLAGRVRQIVPEASVFRMGGDEFCLIVAEAQGGANLAARAADALGERGSGFSVRCSFGVVHVPREATDSDAAMLLSDTRMYEQKGQRRPSAASESHGVLLRALAERNTELGQHNEDVADLVVRVAAELEVAPALMVSIRRAAELHDVGKLAIPDAILNKPGPLDEHEWAFMRRHTLVGERIVASATSLRDVAPIVRASHERWDGAGYPDRVAGEAIPLGARIIAVCDAYDAMITTRPYRIGMSGDDALDELRRCSGAQFDPQVVAAFERVVAARQFEDHALDAQPAGAADELATA